MKDNRLSATAGKVVGGVIAVLLVAIPLLALIALVRWLWTLAFG